MRLGIVLDGDGAVDLAVAADHNGVPAVLVAGGHLGTGIAIAAAVAAATVDTRIVVTLPLGTEHPVTLAEELSVVDHLAAGRTIVLVDTAGLAAEAAAEDLALLRQSWSGRWVTHHGARWRVPAGLHGDSSPPAVSVTPWPAQLELPVWLTGTAAPMIGPPERLPVLMEEVPVEPVDRTRVLPGVATITGDLGPDRDLLLTWAEAGVSHLFVRVPSGFGEHEVQQHLARHLAPEVAMPVFPRIVAESAWPKSWRP